jgi:hypothetical protein
MRLTILVGTATTSPVLAAAGNGIVAAWSSGAPDRSTIGGRVIQ